MPTEIKYDAYSSSPRWGFQIKEGESRHRWIKLDLDPTQRPVFSVLAGQFPATDTIPSSFNSETMVTDYLRALREPMIGILKHNVGEAAVESTPFFYIVTVPAVWSDRAKDKTRSCAANTGMGPKVYIVSEPEAAAIYSLDVMNPHGLQIGDNFSVCDAGGGTVDLISYCVTQLDPVLHIREATKGSGNLCGSTFLNRIFRKYMLDNFGHLRGWEDEILEEAMEKFEKTTKRTFGGNRSAEYVIPVSGLKDNAKKNIRRGKLRLSGAQVATIFEPVVKEVVALILGQLRATKTTPKAVLLVGGFGQSVYLRERIRHALPSSVSLMQPGNGWTAVVRGALIKGLAELSPSSSRVNIDSRIARKHHGISCSTKYNPTVHDVWRAYWSPFGGERQVTVMEWFVKKVILCRVAIQLRVSLLMLYREKHVMLVNLSLLVGSATIAVCTGHQPWSMLRSWYSTTHSIGAHLFTRTQTVVSSSSHS